MKQKLLNGAAAVGKVLAERVTIKLGAFSSVMAVLTWGVLGPMVYPGEIVKMDNPNVMTFKTEFYGLTTDQAAAHIKTANKSITSGERILIKLDSPGGSVFDGMALFDEMRHSKVPIDVYVPAFAASMGANLLMHADRRYVSPQAMILFHGAHAGTYQVSEGVLKEQLDILDSADFKKMLETGAVPLGVSGMQAVQMKKLYETVAQSNLTHVYMEMKSTYDMIKAINDTMVDYIAKKIGKSFEDVRHTLFNDMKSDAIFTGQQLMDMGLITGTDLPDMSPYRP